MRDLTELEIHPRRTKVYPPATEDQILAFERHFEVTLPGSFRTLLRFVNGGRPRLRVYDDPNGGSGEIEDIYSLGSQAEAEKDALEGKLDLYNLWAETAVWRPHLGIQGVPFGSDGGDNQLYLDCSTSPAQVKRMINATRKKYLIASSFESFVDMLRRTNS